MTYGPVNPSPPYLPTTQVFPEDDEQRLVKHTDVYSNIATNVNIREIAIYDLQELSTGQQFFNPADVQNLRSTFRQVYQLPAIAQGATYSVAHGTTGVVAFTRMYGTCITDVVDYRPIPFASDTLVTDQISLQATATNLVVINGATAPNITSGIVVLEYLLN